MENESGVWWDSTNIHGDGDQESSSGYATSSADMVQCYYHQTHQHATRVVACASGYFFGRGKGEFLVVSHGTHLVIYGNEANLVDKSHHNCSKVSRHRDPMATTGNAQSTGSFKALQRIPLNGTCLFLETIHARYQAPGETESSATEEATQDGSSPDKDYLFVYLMKERYLLVELVLTNNNDEEEDNNNGRAPATAAPSMDVRVIVTDSITNPFNVKSVYTLEQITAQPNLQVVALHVYHKVVTILNLKPVIWQYHLALHSEPERWNSVEGLHTVFMEGGHNSTFTVHQHIDEAFVHSIALGLYVNAHDYQVGQPATGSSASGGGGGSTAALAAHGSHHHSVAAGANLPTKPVCFQLRLFLVHDDRRTQQRRHVSYYPMDLHHPKLVQEDHWRSIQLHQDVDATASLVVAVHNGVCLLGDTLMTFVNGIELPRTISLPADVHSAPQCVAPVDGWRFLVAHGQNSVSIVSVHPPVSAQIVGHGTNSGAVSHGGTKASHKASSASAQMLDIHPVAHDVPSPQCLAYLAGGHCFCGSAYGDSVVVHMLQGSPHASGSATASEAQGQSGGSIEVIIPGVGPVSSIISRKVDGHQFVVAGAGGKKDGALCNLKLSVDFESFGELDGMAGLLGCWSCGPFLVLGFEQYNRFLTFNSQGELEEVSEANTGFQGQQRTLCCGAFTATGESNLLQVTEQGITVTDMEGRKVLAQSEFFNGEGTPSHASLFCSNNKEDSFLLVAVGRRVLQYTLADQESLSNPHLVAELESEVACLHCPRPGEVVVGLWQSNKVVLLSQENGVAVQETIFAAPSLPRSVLLVNLNPATSSTRALIVGLADGRLCFGREEVDVPSPGADDVPSTSNHRRFPVTQVMELGTQPVQLSVLATYNGDDENTTGMQPPAVVCCCDFPALVTMPKRSIQVAPVTLGSLSSAANFSPQLVDASVGGMTASSVVVATKDGSVVMGRFTSASSLMKRRLVEQGSVNHMAYHRSSKCLVASVTMPTRDEVALYSMPHMDRQQRRLVLSDHERVTALCATTLGGGEEPYMPFDAVVVSVSFMINEEREPQFSRLAVYNVAPVSPPATTTSGGEDGLTLSLVGSEKEVHGGVYSMCTASYNRLLVGVTGQIDVLSWSHVESSLIVESSVKLNLIPLSLYQHSSANLYVVGDIESSISLLSFNQADHIVVVGRDVTRRNVMDVTMCGEEIVVSDTSGNIVFFNHPAAKEAESKSEKLQEDETAQQQPRSGAEWRGGDDESFLGDGGALADDDDDGDDVPTTTATAHPHHDRSRSHHPITKLQGYQKHAVGTTSCWHQGDTINYLTTGFYSDAGSCSKAFFHNTSLSYIFKSFNTPNVLYGTANGALGSFAPMRIQALPFLSQLLASIEDELHPIGGVGSAAFRRIEAAKVSEKPMRSRGIIDGDTIALYFSFPTKRHQKRVVENLIRRLVTLPSLHRSAAAGAKQPSVDGDQQAKKSGEPEAAKLKAATSQHLLFLPNEAVILEIFRPYLSKDEKMELDTLVADAQNHRAGEGVVVVPRSNVGESIAVQKAELLFTTRTIECLIDDLQRYY